MKYLTIFFLFVTLSLGVTADQQGTLSANSFEFGGTQGIEFEASYVTVVDTDPGVHPVRYDISSSAVFGVVEGLNLRRPSSLVAIFWLIGSVLAGLGLLLTGRSKL